MMNWSEVRALELLKSRGYKDSGILWNVGDSPDFICDDGKRYEVKLLYGSKLIFGKNQINKLRGDDIILVFNRSGFLTEFFWENVNKSHFNIIIESNRNRHHEISLYDEGVFRTLQSMKKKLSRRLHRNVKYCEILRPLLKEIKLEEYKEEI